MPRLRAARTKEEAELVPPTEGIEIVLASDGEPEVVKAPEIPEKPPAVVVQDEPKPDDEAVALKGRLEEAIKAQKLANDALTASQQREQALTRERDESRTQSNQHQQEAEEARYTAIVNALGAAESESVAATQAWESADAIGDTKAKAEAQRRMARSEANLARYEEAKENYEAQREAAKKNPAVQVRQPQAPDNPVEIAIRGMPPQAQTWLRSHPEYVTDVRKNAKLQSLHWEVVDKGHEQFSPAYFESLETELGLRAKPAVTEDDIEEPEVIPAPPPRSRIVPSAPPTRDVPSPSTGRPSNTRVQLTQDERDTAKFSGISDIEYAKQKLKMEALKRQGHYREQG